MFLVKIFTLMVSIMILAVALLLILGRYRLVSVKLDGWISTDPLFERLNSIVSLDRFLLNRLTGVLLFVGSSCVLIFCPSYSEFTGWLADVLRAFSAIFALAGIFIGLGLIIGGKTIRRIDKRLSAWVSTQRLFRSLDRIVRTDDWFYRHNVLVGVLLILGCLFINLRLWLAF